MSRLTGSLIISSAFRRFQELPCEQDTHQVFPPPKDYQIRNLADLLIRAPFHGWHDSADVLLLILVILIALLLLTTLDRLSAIPYFRPSRQEGRDLSVASGAAGSKRPGIGSNNH